MSERMPACALKRLLVCALRPVAVPNGNSERAIATVAPDRKLRPHDDAEAVAKRVKALDARQVVHQPEGVALGIERAAS